MTLEQKVSLGEKAIEYIADYPLYASTCGITYDQAIAIANAVNPEWKKELAYSEWFDGLTPDQQKAEMEKYNAEMQKVRG